MVTVETRNDSRPSIVDANKLSKGLEVLEEKRQAKIRRKGILDEILTCDESFSSLLILLGEATSEITVESGTKFYSEYIVDPAKILGKVKYDGKDVEIDDLVLVIKKTVKMIWDGVARRNTNRDGKLNVEEAAAAFAQVGIGTRVLMPPKVSQNTVERFLDSLPV